MYMYGEKVMGYERTVLNEREARAGAAIMFLFAFISMTNCFMLSSATFAKYFISFFVFDFSIRLIQARYAPSLLIGRLFVQNQDPEYVGAKQKRFSWGLGFFFSLYMFYAFVIAFDITLLAVLLCFICLTMLFLEAAFSICIGCLFYGLIDNHKLMYCPGGSCQIKMKEPVQRFSIFQKFIVTLSALAIISFVYYTTFQLQTKTYMGNKIKEFFMSEDALKARNELEYQQALQEFEQEEF